MPVQYIYKMKILYLSIIVIVTSLALPTAFGSEVNTMPDPKFHAVLDKNSYQNSEKPLLSIFAKPNATVNLLALDSHGLQKLDKTITLENGTITYSLDISSYSPGICSVIVEEGVDEIKLDFAVGLSTMGSGIMLNTDKNSYFPGDNVTIFGWWQPNTMIQLSLIDPNGAFVKSTQIFSDKTGHFHSLNFSIPSIATAGTWKIHGTSGVSNVSVSLTVENIPGAQMVTNDLGDGSVFNMQAKDRGLPSDIIEINGNLVTKDPIKITLNDPNGTIRNSVTTFADRNGDFTSELKIPSDATAGNWKIIGNSGVYHMELNFTVVGNSATETCYGLDCIDLNSTRITPTYTLTHGTNMTSILPPLKQFESGTDPHYIICKQDLELLIKSKDSFPACVKSTSIGRLLKQGWINAHDNNGKYIPNAITLTNTMNITDTKLSTRYSITNATMLDVKADVNSMSLSVTIKTSGDGVLTMTIPNSLVKDPQMKQYLKLYVLIDDQESNYTQTQITFDDRTLSIPFSNGAEKIQIIGTKLI